MTKKTKERGDRRDGTRVRNVDGVHAIMPHLMPNRCDAEVYIQEQIDVTNLMRYLQEKNGPGAEYKTTIFHTIVMAVAKTIYKRPLLNRFIAGKRFFDRNEITISFVVKRQFQDGAEEALMTLRVEDDMTLEDVSRKIIGDSAKLRQEAGTNDIDQVLGKLAKLPRFVMRIMMAAFRFLDFHDKMPAFICDGDPNYSTAMLTNLGSIGCSCVYHHLNNYGTNSLLIAVGTVHQAQIIGDDGEAEIRDVVDLGVTLDERIADGFYFARSVKLLEEILSQPEILEKPVKEEVDYEC
ncbi:2-oxo acid dehydrogenase subunit E2 [Eubacteriales bacterium DFI.9.88]|uniref:2-oxo acid dehydrogenase subunit E2 n=1 Tax=Hominibacterium faecale TaxID=2839743 RepID=UPI0022B2986C|nr:2-oxo acid dehydrogenase subunit E2 [Hominibacterium faecale]MDE8734488.1 2-oxo acid dehydrogenase subunit E2 [Eubacteriales bacterium DFI.9.88]